MWNIAGVDIGAECGISLMLIDIGLNVEYR